MTLEIHAASVADTPVLYNLLQLCLHDYSEFNGEDVDVHGVFSSDWSGPTQLFHSPPTHI